MHTYTIRAKPDIRKAGANWPALSEKLLVDSLADVAVRELSEDTFGRVTVDVELRRSGHDDALGELARLVERSGYALVDVTVTEWVSATAQRALLAGATTLLGAGASKNPLVGIATGAASTLIAEEAGLIVDRVLAEYAASRDVVGQWSLTRVSQAKRVGAPAAAGFSQA